MKDNENIILDENEVEAVSGGIIYFHQEKLSPKLPNLDPLNPEEIDDVDSVSGATPVAAAIIK